MTIRVLYYKEKCQLNIIHYIKHHIRLFDVIIDVHYCLLLLYELIYFLCWKPVFLCQIVFQICLVMFGHLISSLLKSWWYFKTLRYGVKWKKTISLLCRYAAFLVKYPWTVLGVNITVVILSAILGLVSPTGAKAYPDFSQPHKVSLLSR